MATWEKQKENEIDANSDEYRYRQYCKLKNLAIHTKLVYEKLMKDQEESEKAPSIHYSNMISQRVSDSSIASAAD